MKVFSSDSNSIVINGKSYCGSSIDVVGGKVIIDGVEQDGDDQKIINITIYGNVDSIDGIFGTVKCENVGRIKTASGDVECGDVSGNVTTMSGDVEAKSISGNVSTMSGDISR